MHGEANYSKLRTGETPDAVAVEQLDEIKVTIVSAPSEAEMKQTLAVFLGNTWNDAFTDEFDEETQNDITEKVFDGKLLPTALETVQIVWAVAGLDMIDTTHLIRHRLFSFSAQVHGDRDMRHDRILVKPGIMATKFADRFVEICEQARSLYCEMLDSGEVHGLDARTIMPRCFEHFYIVRCNIKDLIGYVKMRRDEQIQTQSDNIVALKLWLEVVRRYPTLKRLIDLDEPDVFYCRQVLHGLGNIFPPNERNRKWLEERGWKEGDSYFYHNKPRDEYPGSDSYLRLRDRLIEEIANA